MKTGKLADSQEQASAMVAVLIIMLILVTSIASLAAYVTHTVRLAGRRADIVSAIQFTQGGAAVAADDLNRALTNSAVGRTMFQNLTTGANAYTLRSDLTTSAEKVYERSITSPFSNQTVIATIRMTNSSTPPTATIIAKATVKNVTQTSTLHVRLKFGYGAAIISDNPGTTESGIAKSIAQNGNVVVNGDKSGPIVVDGGSGLGIWANGNANIDPTYASIPPSAIQKQSYNTVNQIPDYTADGSTDQLFDFSRFIAVADVSRTHYTNLSSFFAANNAASASAAKALEGVIVVDISKSDKGSLDPTSVPLGINVRGTLVFNFSSEFSPLDKIINTATMNINAANLSGLNAADPTTYPNGYPPTYYDSSKNPVNVNISSKGFSNFTADEDLPALMYNVGVLDIHGNANICGVIYTPSFMEIENKADGQIQYFKGSLIGGGGIYFENLHHSTSVISYESSALDMLATSSNKGKHVVATYWE
jgi:hypothetical protein